MSLADIYNVIRIDAETLLAGQPTEQQFRDARADGFDAVVNLAPDGLSTSLPDEAQVLADLGFEYRHIPVPWAEPQATQLDAFLSAMEEFRGRKVMIHCQANYRVTAFYALYAIKELGWTRAQAQTLIDRVWTSRPGFRMDERWTAFVEQQACRMTTNA